ncbi:hypothetical protein, partial [Cytobacillus kochii]|uniref:hypothetical protein n=1 Tax=Cytobacillus kochii TaxID=859143 RepID=UPI003F7D8A3A
NSYPILLSLTAPLCLISLIQLNGPIVEYRYVIFTIKFLFRQFVSKGVNLRILYIYRDFVLNIASFLQTFRFYFKSTLTPRLVEV